ncbi:MAG: homoprotocatechuate degradation operon regulator HpaR [Rhodobacteraceae bacterium]|nr:homoprotocatechuate degradation operon regulator HpaR [Paracoccaceae bacterium]
MSPRPGISERSLPIMLLRAREAVMQRFRPMLKAHGLSEQQWRVLRVLDERGPTAPTQLAAECVILMPSLTRILAHLEAEGLIHRQLQKADKRRQIAALSDRGRDLIARISPESAAIYAALEGDFGADNLQDMMAALRALIATLNEQPQSGQ